jgi:hypothetical protein
MLAQARVSGRTLASIAAIAAIGTAALLFTAPIVSAAALQEKAPPPARVEPQTVPEATDYARTSTSSEVAAFVAQCVQQGGAKLAQLSMGKSTEGKELTLVLAADPPVRSIEEARASARPKALVFANIHAGEVEGKEAVQILLREIAQGQHAELLKQLVVAFVPNYNPDGNDKIDRKNRADQAGPVEGVGQRANGMNLDLNRDYMKGEAPETQALIRTVRALDAMLVMDLHTTDGSYHGYELTYSGIFHPACDPALLEFTEKRLLPELRAGMATRGFATFDYGDFNDGAHPEKGWSTFDCKPRYGTNYFGFQNCLTLLSEAYSHERFDVRIAATRACVLEGLSLAAKHAAAIQAMRAAAAKSAAALVGTPLPTGGEATISVEKTPVLVGAVREEKDPVTGLKRLWDTGESHPVEMPSSVHFNPVRERRCPPAGSCRRRPPTCCGSSSSTASGPNRSRVHAARPCVSSTSRRRRWQDVPSRVTLSSP